MLRNTARGRPRSEHRFLLALALLTLAAAGPPTKPPKKPAVEELPSNSATEQTLLKEIGDKFKLRRTPHFVVLYDTDEPTLREFINRIEPTYRAVTQFAAKMGVTVQTPDEKLQILFFNDFADYASYAKGMKFPASQEAPGFYTFANNRSAFFNYANAEAVKTRRAELEKQRAQGKHLGRGTKAGFPGIHQTETQLDRRQERVNCLIVQHEVAHQVFYNIGLHVRGVCNPRWFVEGLAMMFETPPGRGGAGLGAINQERLRDWRAFDAKYELPDLRTMIGDPATLLPGNPKALAGYAQGWALVHYLQRNKQKQLVAYIDAIRDRKPDRIYAADEELATFENAFGSLNDSFVEKWKAFMKKVPYKPSDMH